MGPTEVDPPYEATDAATIDGNTFRDDFEDGSNVTLSGAACVHGGMVRLDMPLVLQDDFERTNVTPWIIEQGKVSISSGTLVVGPTSTVSIARRNLDVANVIIEGRFMVPVESNWGPTIEIVSGTRVTRLTCDKQLLTLSGTMTQSTHVSLEPDVWYSFMFHQYQGFVQVSCAGRWFNVQDKPGGNITGLRLITAQGNECRFDDFSVVALASAEGVAESSTIELPYGHRWDVLDLGMSYSVNANFLDIVDARTGIAIPGFCGHNGVRVDLEGLDFVRHPAIRLRAHLSSEDWGYPFITSWSVGWTEGLGWMDGLDDMTGLVSWENLRVLDGELTSNPLLWTDGFSRAELSPWVPDTSTSGGSVVLDDGSALFDGGGVESGWASLERSLDQRDVYLEWTQNFTRIGHQTFNLSLLTSSGRWVALAYNAIGCTYLPNSWDGRTWSKCTVAESVLPAGVPIRYQLLSSRGGGLYFKAESGTTDTVRFSGTLLDVGENFTLMRFTWGNGTSGTLDDVRLHQARCEAIAVSGDITLPKGMAWRDLQLSDHEDKLLDILDGLSGEAVPGLEGISWSWSDLTGLDPDRHPTIRLRLRATQIHQTTGGSVPVPTKLDWWRVGWERAAPLFLEPFDDDSNVTIGGRVEVADGTLRTTNLLLKDYFDRLEPEPWIQKGGGAEIWSEYLWTRCDESAGMMLERALPRFDDINISLRLSPRYMCTDGWFGIELEMRDIDYPGGTHVGSDISVVYRNGDGRVYLQGTASSSTSSGPIGNGSVSRPFDAVVGDWTNLELQIVNGSVTARFGELALALGGRAGLDEVSTLMLMCGGSEVLWDNILVTQLRANGTATSAPFDLPSDEGHLWLSVRSSLMAGSWFCITAVDAITLEAIKDVTQLEGGALNLSGVDCSAHSSLRLRFEMMGQKDSFADIDWFRLHWADEPGDVFLKRPLGTIYMREDEPVIALLDLHDYLTARGVGKDQLSYEVTSMSDPERVRPRIEGSLLSIDLPTRDWHGTAMFRVTCSYADSSASTGDVLVVVEPVDDPPVFEDPGEVYVVEEVPYVVSLGDLITDVDTPVEWLVLRVDDPRCTVTGLYVEMVFKTGGFSVDIEVSVNDGVTTVIRTLRVHVEEVNDLPVLDTLPALKAVEDEPTSFDLSPFVEDEETSDADLVLTVEGGSHVLSVNGLVLRLLFSRGGTYDLQLSVSDGIVAVPSVLRVDVEERNDAPVIIGLGDLRPPVVVTIPEGAELSLPVVAFDEDGDALSYMLESDWDMIWVDNEGVVHLVSEITDVGNHTVMVAVEDGRGGRDELEFIVRVLLLNDPPTVPNILSPANRSSWLVGSPLELRATVFDPDLPAGQRLWLTWSSNASGELDNSTWNGSNLVVVSDLPPGVHRLTVTVWDGEFARSSWVEVTVEAPEIPPEDDGLLPRVASGGLLAFILAVAVALTLALLYVKRKRGTLKTD